MALQNDWDYRGTPEYQQGLIDGALEERQFILNILDGIDLADAQMGLPHNTKAIRFALQSRFIGGDKQVHDQS